MPPRKSASAKPVRRRATTKTTPVKTAARATGHRHIWTGAAWLVLAVVLGAYLVIGLGIYLFDWSGSFVRTATTVFNYPASTQTVPGYLGWFLLSVFVLLALILATLRLIYLFMHNRRDLRVLAPTGLIFAAALLGYLFLPPVTNAVVSQHSFLTRVESLEHFQDRRNQLSQAQGAPTQQPEQKELHAQALQQLVLADVIRQEAKKYDVKIEDKNVDEAYKQYVDRNQGEENFKKQLKDLLGWNPSDFKEEITVKLMEEKVNEKLATDDNVNKDRRERAEGFLKQVRDEKKDFAEVAKQSDDPTSQTGGDQGFVKKGESDPAIEEVAFRLQAGEISDIIKTQRGYVILKVEEKRDDSVKMRQILVRTKALQEALPEDLREANIAIYVKDIIWNPQSLAIQPRDAQPESPAPQGTGAPSAAPAASAPPAPPS